MNDSTQYICIVPYIAVHRPIIIGDIVIYAYATCSQRTTLSERGRKNLDAYVNQFTQYYATKLSHEMHMTGPGIVTQRGSIHIAADALDSVYKQVRDAGFIVSVQGVVLPEMVVAMRLHPHATEMHAYDLDQNKAWQYDGNACVEGDCALPTIEIVGVEDYLLYSDYLQSFVIGGDKVHQGAQPATSINEETIDFQKLYSSIGAEKRFESVRAKLVSSHYRLSNPVTTQSAYLLISHFFDMLYDIRATQHTELSKDAYRDMLDATLLPKNDYQSLGSAGETGTQGIIHRTIQTFYTVRTDIANSPNAPREPKINIDPRFLGLPHARRMHRPGGVDNPKSTAPLLFPVYDMFWIIYPYLILYTMVSHAIIVDSFATRMGDRVQLHEHLTKTIHRVLENNIPDIYRWIHKRRNTLDSYRFRGKQI